MIRSFDSTSDSYQEERLQATYNFLESLIILSTADKFNEKREKKGRGKITRN